MLEPQALASCSNRNLPVKVWSEILSRMPVRSLVQWRCVSKTWRALIDHPVFARLHLTRSNDSCDETRLFVVQQTSRGQECVVKCSKTWRTIENLATIETYPQSSNALPTLPIHHHDDGDEIRNWNVSSSVDGLIMLSSLDFKHGLMLWNPSIRKARRVPHCPEISREVVAVDLGLGFDPVSGDYKHVVFVYTAEFTDYEHADFVHTAEFCLRFFAIYTVGTNSWKTVEFQAEEEFSCTPDNGTAICIGGVLYAEPNISFDLRTETLGLVSYPADTNLLVCSSRLAMADCERSLAWVRLTHNNGYIWVLQESTWTQRYKFALAIPECVKDIKPRFLYLKKNGEALLGWRTKAVTSSNLETHEENVILEESLDGANAWIYVCLYKESLLLLS